MSPQALDVQTKGLRSDRTCCLDRPQWRFSLHTRRLNMRLVFAAVRTYLQARFPPNCCISPQYGHSNGMSGRAYSLRLGIPMSPGACEKLPEVAIVKASVFTYADSGVITLGIVSAADLWSPTGPLVLLGVARGNRAGPSGRYLRTLRSRCLESVGYGIYGAAAILSLFSRRYRTNSRLLVIACPRRFSSHCSEVPEPPLALTYSFTCITSNLSSNFALLDASARA